ncbi:alpha-D-ribose 1-methylphosphonate 5-triphosphate diphosphatase [Thiosocius teredinicola]|uniref:alpha-D-ribose 1-methylphosphonate 5-triphosphate diphosphatase n=1 Tax=Thiosocius teredinicola TaxID=1973002 RepID=UPI00099139F5
MNSETVLSNAQIVMPDCVIKGTVCLHDGKIKAVDEGHSQLPSVVDLDGDYLIAGLIELHTDNLEKHFSPRPTVSWPAMPAIFAHDAAVASAGITTVFNAVATGDVIQGSSRIQRFRHMTEAVRQAHASDLTRAEHLLHIRCEVTYEPTLENFTSIVDDPLVKLVSVMDHSPGQRQFADINKYREYYQGKYKLSDEEMEAQIQRQTETSLRLGRHHRAAIAEMCRERGLSLASHDDATIEHVEEAVADGMSIAEFPTTVGAANASRHHGLHVLMGAPNVVRGFSHSGNVSARELAQQGLLDTLSSDYVPNSLLHAAFVLAQHIDHIQLPEAVAMVNLNPADAAGLHDRGSIAVDKRADLIRVRCVDDVPVVRQVWRQGTRVV